MLRHSRDRLLHWLFEASLAIKGLLTSLEALAGLGLIVTPNPLIARFVLVLLLWRKVVWAYPAAMVVLAGFVGYQLYEFVHAGAPFLLLLAVFDLVMIGLVWQEWKALSGRVAPAA